MAADDVEEVVISALRFPIPAVLASLVLVGCDGCRDDPTLAGPRPSTVAEGASISLLSLAPSDLDVPPSSRPGGTPPAEAMPLAGPFTHVGTVHGGMHQWSMPVPFRPRGLFFHNPQPGMEVRGPDGQLLQYKRYGKASEPYWSHDKDLLYIYTPDRTTPEAGAFTFSYPRATERERALNLDLSGESPAEFVLADVTDDWDSRHGLLVPAPGRLTWALTLPPAAEMQFTAGLVEPEIRDGASDGAAIVVEVAVPGEPVATVLTADVAARDWRPTRIDLSRWAGKEVSLTVRTEPRGTPDYDYVFLGEPVVSSNLENPVTVLMVFIDTLRVDHLGLYGYNRDTSPKLDAFARNAAVFTNARTVAPWTLPSARSLITGMQPEAYNDPSTRTLPAILSGEGWSTAMFAGNVYLSANFDMARDWGLHRVGMWPRAQVVTDDAIAWLEAHQGRNVLLQVHYMDPHLPYNEPKSHRYLFAGEAQGGLREEFHLSDVRRADTNPPAVRRYIQDRYDNNVRYATDQVDRLLQRLDDNDVVVIFADHGEEFWDHRNFEHGHTLFDELLKVPLIIDGPGIGGTRSDVPASILDLTPTILDALGHEHEGLDGASLLPVARGEAGAADPFSGRTLAFGRPLYGSERWGVLTAENQKWTTSEGREALYDLDQDPGEKHNLIANMDGEAGEPYHAPFSEALGRPLRKGFRLWASFCRTGAPEHDLEASMIVPGGVEKAWVGADPLQHSSAEVHIVGDAVVAKWHAGYRGERNIWVIPKLPIEEVTHQLEINARQGDEVAKLLVPPQAPAGLSKVRVPLTRYKFDCRLLALTHALTPELDDAEQIDGSDPEMKELLEALGYAARDEDPNKPNVSDGVRAERRRRGLPAVPER